MTDAGPIVAWIEFTVDTHASRADALTLGRDACRSAFAQAAQQWSSLHGDPPWRDAAFAHDHAGAPILRAADAPTISLCHARGLAGCAIASPQGHLVGIDAELADAPGMLAVRNDAERSGEASLTWPESCALDWPARLWCAKESAVKAERQGADLLGRTLRVLDILPPAPAPAHAAGSSTLDLVVRSHLNRIFAVRTSRRGAFVIASVLGEHVPTAAPTGT